MSTPRGCLPCAEARAGAPGRAIQAALHVTQPSVPTSSCQGGPGRAAARRPRVAPDRETRPLAARIPYRSQPWEPTPSPPAPPPRRGSGRWPRIASPSRRSPGLRAHISCVPATATALSDGSGSEEQQHVPSALATPGWARHDAKSQSPATTSFSRPFPSSSASRFCRFLQKEWNLHPSKHMTTSTARDGGCYPSPPPPAPRFGRDLCGATP